MSNKHIVNFNIKGISARPDTIGMGELGDLLKRLEAAIRSAVSPEDRIEQSGNPDPLVSLVSLREGDSSDMGMAVLDYGVPALAGITEAIATGDYSRIAPDSQAELSNISKWVSRRKFELEIEEDSQFNIRRAVISRKRPVPSPSSTALTVDGVTTAWGYLVRAGGEKPRAALRFPNGTKVTITADEIVTKELGGRLYEDVGIEGIGTWRIRDWKLVAFKATRVLEYRPQQTDPVQTFKDLANASKGRWDEIDAETFVREIRGETQQ